MEKRIVKLTHIITDSIYGKKYNSKINIEIYELEEKLKEKTKKYLANHNFALGKKIYSGEYKIDYDSIVIDGKKKLPPGIRLSLDKDFFQIKILDKAQEEELKNNSNFINYFKGLYVSTSNNCVYKDGFIASLDLLNNNVDFSIFYKDNKKR